MIRYSITIKCDKCNKQISKSLSGKLITQTEAMEFVNHARSKGWQIGEKQICPNCQGIKTNQKGETALIRYTVDLECDCCRQTITKEKIGKPITKADVEKYYKESWYKNGKDMVCPLCIAEQEGKKRGRDFTTYSMTYRKKFMEDYLYKNIKPYRLLKEPELKYYENCYESLEVPILNKDKQKELIRICEAPLHMYIVERTEMR